MEPVDARNSGAAATAAQRIIAWIVAHGHRRVRYRGIERNQLWLDHRVAAIDLRQLIRRRLTRTDGTWAIA
jgi:hypothetical protein